MSTNAEETLTAAVLKVMQQTPDPRLREVMTSLIKHLHGFVREVRPTVAEWEAGINYVTGIGQAVTETHHEVIMNSDIWGVSSLVGIINRSSTAGVSEAALLGPFWRLGAPDMPNGSSIARENTGGEQVFMRGRETSPDGKPIANALVDVWQSDPSGLYDNQQPELDGLNLRGRFRTDADGRYEFITVKPAAYPVPTHAPAGKLLLTQKRSTHRPAHVHLMVSSPGYQTLITQVFVEGDKYLDNDVTFSVIPSLVGRFQQREDLQGAPKGITKAPWYLVEFDVVLEAGESRFPNPPIR